VHGLTALKEEIWLILTFEPLLFSQNQRKNRQNHKKTTIFSYVFVAFLQKWVKVILAKKNFQCNRQLSIISKVAIGNSVASLFIHKK
jgi:hypothetical protein